MATGVQVWSKTAATNATADSNINFAEGQAPSSVNDSCRSLMGAVASFRDDNNGTLVTSGTTAAFTLVTNQVESALTAGFTVSAQFHATNETSATLAVDGLTAKPLRVYPGATLNMGELGGGSVHSFTYTTTGTGEWVFNSPPAFTILTNATTVDVLLNNTGTYFTGPTVTQGTSGTWFVTGTITCLDTGGPAIVHAKLWDGTTVIGSAISTPPAASSPASIALSGIITSPAGNLKISAKDITAVTGKILFNQTANSKDSTITAIRIG